MVGPWTILRADEGGVFMTCNDWFVRIPVRPDGGAGDPVTLCAKDMDDARCGRERGHVGECGEPWEGIHS